MLNWARRVEELHYYVSSTYQISDTQAVDILLAAFLPVPRTPAQWLIIEINWYSCCCDSAWFSFGGTWRPRSLGEIRSMRPRKANELISEWLNEPQVPRLLVGPDGEKLHHPRHLRCGYRAARRGSCPQREEEQKVLWDGCRLPAQTTVLTPQSNQRSSVSSAAFLTLT